VKVLVNALSATNLSGRQALLGHLSRLARWTAGEHVFVVLYHAANRDLVRDLGSNVSWAEAPAAASHWTFRSLWERTRLPGLARRLRAELYFTPSGAVTGGLDIPQVSMALNPWCFVRRVHRGAGERLKARLQRFAYRQAVRKAAMMAYASRYLQDAYRANAGVRERAAEVVYPALDDETAEAVASPRTRPPREKRRIVCVSRMAWHKGVETVVEAVDILRREHGIEAELRLVGGWASADYERFIRGRVERLGLSGAVAFDGHVTRQQLLESYARARVFCLMSWCESFGIPSVEAQALGLPVVVSNCCAMPEVCGEGGLYPEPGDAAGTARALAALLGDEGEWRRRSEAALANAARFRYDITSRPLMRMFERARP